MPASRLHLSGSYGQMAYVMNMPCYVGSSWTIRLLLLLLWLLALALCLSLGWFKTHFIYFISRTQKPIKIDVPAQSYTAGYSVYYYYMR